MKPVFYLIRHAESEGNVNPQVYFETPDHRVKLTEAGRAHALGIGSYLVRDLNNYINSNIKVWTSPYTRTRQTCDLMLKGKFPVKEDPRIREQEWGHIAGLDDRDSYRQKRKQVGHFFYRFPNGESGADVYDRCSHFLESVFRDDADAVVIFTHGLTLRILAMRLLHATYEEFESWDNPGNCELKIWRHNGERYTLTEPFRTWK